MKLTIHRGAKEIGGTCIELCSGKTRIILDYGMPLGGPGEKEAVTPQLFDIPGLYKGQEPLVDGILVSHSHKDHIGLLNYVNPAIPVHLSSGVNKLIDVLNVFTRKDNIIISNPHIVEHKKSFEVGGFKITPYLVDHSGFDAMSYLIEEKATGKQLFYTGDFRATGWKRALFERFIKNPPKNVNYLLMEGTMIDRQAGKYAGEQAVSDAVEKVLKGSKNNVVLAYCSGQNIDRIVAFYKAARSAKTKLIIDPYIAAVLHVLRNERNTIPQMDWKDIRVLVGDYFGKRDIYVNKIAASKLKYLVRDIGKHKINAREIGKEKCLVVMRDTMIPVISRIPGIKGAALIYSQWEGYIRDKEKSFKFWGFVDRNGLKVDHIHTSGHAVISTLKRLAAALKPKNIIPVHTERPEKYKDIFGKNVILVKDGEPLEL